MKITCKNGPIKMRPSLGRLLAGTALGAVLLLTGCAGTVKSDMKEGAISTNKVQGVFEITTQIAASAEQKIVDNPQFNRNELADWVKRRLDAKGLIAPGSKNRVEITITDVRIRNAVTAIMLGVFAGADIIAGQVRLIDEYKRPVRTFDVTASYAFGGIGGGQDGLRMNWLYEKFSELTMIELDKTVALPEQSMKSSPVPVPVASANAPKVSAPVAPVSVAPSAIAPTSVTNPAEAAAAPGTPQNLKGPLVKGATFDINNADMIPLVYNGCRKFYREEFLIRGPPRSFVISESGHCFASWGKVPPDPSLPIDVTQRALQHCYNAGRKNCTVYVVDTNVVYQPKVQ